MQMPAGKITYNTYNKQPTEIVIAHVCPCGLDKSFIFTALEKEAAEYGYAVQVIKISEIILGQSEKKCFSSSLDRVEYLMDQGDRIRGSSQNNSMLAMMAVSEIQKRRKASVNELETGKIIWVIDSLKHSQEALELQKIYSNGFHLIATHVDIMERKRFFSADMGKNDPERIDRIIGRDKQGGQGCGQQTEKVFQYADYFLRYNGSKKKTEASIKRFLGLLFGNPHINSTFNEYAMYMAYAASTRSGDLSRQVGAVIAKDQDILALGANDCPRFRGGLYWPEYDTDKEDVVEHPQGKDHVRGEDFNQKERMRIYGEICEVLGQKFTEDIKRKLDQTTLSGLTEFGRMVHAEMEAILSCARKGVSPKGGTLYCTTFPCHNCAKHIIACGIEKIFYIQPYPKSRALEMHNDALSLDDTDLNKVVFEPYVGVGPRRYVDLFSMDLGVGVPICRKDDNTGKRKEFIKRNALPRLRMLPGDYREVENLVVERLREYAPK